MRRSITTRGGLALAIALATGAAVGSFTLGAAPAYAQKDKKAKAPPAMSKEFVAIAAPIEQKLAAAKAAQDKGDAAGVQAALAGAREALPAVEAAAKNPQEKLIAGQFAVSLGNYLKDQSLQMRGVQLMVDSRGLDPAKQGELQVMLGKMAYQNKDYATAQANLGAAVAAGYGADQDVEVLVDSYAKANNAQAGLAELRKIVAARRAAGKPIPESWYKRANTVAYNAKLGPEAMEWAMAHVEAYPSSFNWLGSTQLVRRFANYGPNENVDLFRLMMRSGAFDNDPKYVTNEFKEYIEAADPRKLPGEVVAVIDKGIATKALAGNQWAAEMRTMANGRIAGDKASLPAQERAARAKASGDDAAIIGDVYLNYGQPAKAEELFKLALQKGVTDKDRTLTRLGIAQYDQGKYAEARASFRQVGGARTAIARLWQTFVNTKDPAGARAG